MASWHQQWNDPNIWVGQNDFFQQVGRTMGGKPVPAEQLDFLVDSILDTGIIGPGDLVLDICCGNGQITQRLAHHCGFIVGLDFSEPLITTANRHFSGANIHYHQGSATEISEQILPPEIVALRRRLDSVTLLDAMQYFETDEMRIILTRLRFLCRPGFSLFCGGIPDQACLWNFYNTDQRRADYERRLIRDGRDAIGHWWQRQEVMALADDAGFECRIMDQSPKRYAAHYRFDAVLTYRNNISLSPSI